MGGHARRADAADLLLIGDDAAEGVFRRALIIEHRHHRRIRADAVVVAVGQNHAAVKAHIARLARRNDLKLRGEEILLLHAVFIRQQLEHVGLHRVLFLALKRPATDDQVERLALDHFLRVLGHLLLREVHQQVGDAEHRVVFVLADVDDDLFAGLPDDHAVQRQRDGDPLIFLDAAVIMRIQIRQIGILIERVLLHVDARGVDVRAEDIHALLQRLLAQHEEHEALAHPVGIDARARFQLPARANDRVQILKAVRLRQLLAVGHALALRFAVVDEIAVCLGKGFHPAVVPGICRPRIFSFHGLFLFPPFFGLMIVFVLYYRPNQLIWQARARFPSPRPQPALLPCAAPTAFSAPRCWPCAPATRARRRSSSCPAA